MGVYILILNNINGRVRNVKVSVPCAHGSHLNSATINRRPDLFKLNGVLIPL